MKPKSILSMAAILLFSFFVGCSESPTEPEIKNYEVKYEISGTATTVDITYTNSTGGTSQLSDVSVPWTLTFRRDEGEFVYVSAQNQNDTGSVTATIYRDGSTLQTSTSSGAYVIATASGSL